MNNVIDPRITRLEAENRAYAQLAAANTYEITMLRTKIVRLRDALAPYANAADAIYRNREAKPIIPPEAWEEARAAMSIIGGGRLRKHSTIFAFTRKLLGAK